MVVNPFKFQENVEVDDSQDFEYEEKEIVSKLQENIINKYIDYLRDGMKDKLIEKLHADIIDDYGINNENEIQKIINILIDKMFGYGILQKYIDDSDVTDIRAVAFNKIYIKKIGTWSKCDLEFSSESEFEEYIRYCALKNNAKINYDIPINVFSDRKNNLRIEMGIEPVNVKSPSIVIRIHRFDKNVSLESLFLVDNMLDADSYSLIINAIKSGKNIILSGKGGSGKTTLLRAIIKKVPDNVSISINEETSELNITGKNVIQREVISNRSENKNISLEKLMKQSLVMSNDIIVVGEIKGAETSVFIDAITTGHIGYATVHSDCANNTLDRLVTLFKRDYRAQMYEEKFIKNILVNSIDYIIYLKNYKVIQIIGKGNIKNEFDILYDNGEK